jgi:hypothetical protein
MARNYDEKLNTVKDWVTVINEFWHQHQGVLNNKHDFWDTVIHSMTDQDWNDVYTVADIMSRQEPEQFRKYSNFQENLQELNKRLMLGKPVIRKFDRQSYNKAPFQVLMAIKDHINETQGTPTERFPEQPQQEQPKTAKQIREYRREINITIQERLFEI